MKKGAFLYLKKAANKTMQSILLKAKASHSMRSCLV